MCAFEADRFKKDFFDTFNTDTVFWPYPRWHLQILLILTRF